MIFENDTFIATKEQLLVEKSIDKTNQRLFSDQ